VSFDVASLEGVACGSAGECKVQQRISGIIAFIQAKLPSARFLIVT
jgi:hypothetical protein